MPLAKSHIPALFLCRLTMTYLHSLFPARRCATVRLRSQATPTIIIGCGICSRAVFISLVRGICARVMFIRGITVCENCHMTVILYSYSMVLTQAHGHMRSCMTRWACSCSPNYVQVCGFSPCREIPFKTILPVGDLERAH